MRVNIIESHEGEMYESDPEEKKTELERKRKEALEKTKLGPLSGGGNGESIPLTSVALDRDDNWVMSFRLFANVRAAWGVESVKGKWEVVDWDKFNKVDSVKREKLRPYWNKPL